MINSFNIYVMDYLGVCIHIITEITHTLKLDIDD